MSLTRVITGTALRRRRRGGLIILLPAGFIVGAITTDVNPQELLGAAFQPLVSLAVAVILYDSGMSLNLRKLRGHVRRIVVRLIVMGVPVTLAFAAVFSGLLLNMSLRAAVMLGAILVVSGPTVVGPLLSFIRPTERLQHVLSWEGSLIDRVGGILGAVVFHAVIATTRRGPAYQLGQFLLGIGVGPRIDCAGKHRGRAGLPARGPAAQSRRGRSLHRWRDPVRLEADQV
jgi:NhaP-type Na+/H+ or K+/H+ antiporter